MKFLVVLAVAVACASADVSHIVNSADASAPIVRSEYDISPEGNFHYAYETGNGINAQADGVVKGQGENAAVEIKGSFRYTGNDGVPIELTYVADENGFQPQGNHLPQPPPIPELIARSLEYIAAHPNQESNNYASKTANVASASAKAVYGK